MILACHYQSAYALTHPLSVRARVWEDASAIGTCVLQLKEIPPRPKELDGAISLWNVKDDLVEADIRLALDEFGVIVRCEIGNRRPVVVQFERHESAVAAKAAAPRLGRVCAAIDTLYNERSYDGGSGGAEGREGDGGRGWCCFEDAVSSELVVRLSANPKVRTALAALQQPKMLALSSGKEPMVIDLDEEHLEDRVERVVARIQHATFTGKGDQQVVPALYKGYVGKLADALVQTLALAGAEAAHAPIIPPMPIVPLPEPEPLRLADGQLVLLVNGNDSRRAGGEGDTQLGAVLGGVVRRFLAAGEATTPLTFDALAHPVLPWHLPAAGWDDALQRNAKALQACVHQLRAAVEAPPSEPGLSSVRVAADAVESAAAQQPAIARMASAALASIRASLDAASRSLTAQSIVL